MPPNIGVNRRCGLGRRSHGSAAYRKATRVGNRNRPGALRAAPSSLLGFTELLQRRVQRGDVSGEQWLQLERLNLQPRETLAIE